MMIGLKRLCGWPITLTVLFAGCAGRGPTPDGSPKALSVDGKATELGELRTSLRTLEDSLVLDVLLGYRVLFISTENQGTADAATADALRRARFAYTQLEFLLQHGGIKNRGGEERSFLLPGGEKVTLRELTEQLSRVMLKSGVDGNWNLAAEKAREIQKRKPELSALVEDAGWTVALVSALESSTFPDEVKKRMKFLHESYSHEAPHDEIVKQVNGLLNDVQEERFRKELKKLANRSWERDKRKGKMDSVAAIASPGSIHETPSGSVGAEGNAESGAALDSTLQGSRDRVDTLVSRGRYLEALRAVESLEDRDPGFAKARRQTLGDRYCAERRSAAAATFSSARKAAVDSVRVRFLQQSMATLDSCLFHFPEAGVADKVRRNREAVEKELHK